MNVVRYEKLLVIFLGILMICFLSQPYHAFSQTDTTESASTEGTETQPPGSAGLQEEKPPTIQRDTIYYDSEGNTDPFVSLLTGLVPDGDKIPKPPGIKGMTIGELNTFGLGVWGEESVAFVTGSDGLPYTLKVGDIVFDGRVKAITKDKLIFEKWVYDVWNKPKPPKTIEIKLHPTVEEVTR